MYFVYILQSILYGRYYIGHTENIDGRLIRHNEGRVRSSKSYKPWKIVHTEKYKTKSEVCKRELEIKSYKSGIKFKKLLGFFKENGEVA